MTAKSSEGVKMSLVRTGIIAAAILFASSALGQEPSSVPQPTYGDVRYGAHERNVLDLLASGVSESHTAGGLLSPGRLHGVE